VKAASATVPGAATAQARATEVIEVAEATAVTEAKEAEATETETESLIEKPDRGQACDSCDSAYALQRFRIKTIS